MTIQTDRAEITVLIETPGWLTAIPDVEHRILDRARRTLDRASPGLTAPGLCIMLTDDARVRALNAEWRGQDKPTNVLSFPSEDRVPGAPIEPPPWGQPLELGDLVMAFETCRGEADARDIPLAHHLDHLLVHGLLHLLGHDHIDEVEATGMERLKAEILAVFGIPDPYREEVDV